MSQDLRNRPPEAMPEEGPMRVSRRSLLGGLVAAAVAPAIITKAWAQTGLAPPEALPRRVEVAAAPTAASAPIPRYQHASAALTDGRILVVGGWRHSGLSAYIPPLADTQIYDPSANVWTQAASLKMARAEHAAVTLADGRILVVGGINHAPLASVEIYDPSANTWTTVAPMGQARYAHAASFTDGLVIVSGGFNPGPLASVQIYNVAADAWRLVRG